MKKYSVLRWILEVCIAAFLLLPLIVTFIYSFAERWVTVLPNGFTLKYYIKTLTNSQFLMGILRDMLISAAPVLITNISVLFALYVVIVYLPGMEKMVQIFCLIPTTINGIILATSVLGTYAGTNTIFANRIIMLMFIYSVFIMPVTYQGIRNSLYAVNTHAILEAAEMLGYRKIHSYITIVIPAILPGLSTSALMSFAGLFGDFAIIKIIASSQYETAQSYLYRNRATDTQALSAAVVILLILTGIVNYVVNKSQNEKKGSMER